MRLTVKPWELTSLKYRQWKKIVDSTNTTIPPPSLPSSLGVDMALPMCQTLSAMIQSSTCPLLPWLKVRTIPILHLTFHFSWLFLLLFLDRTYASLENLLSDSSSALSRINAFKVDMWLVRGATCKNCSSPPPPLTLLLTLKDKFTDGKNELYSVGPWSKLYKKSQFAVFILLPIIPMLLVNQSTFSDAQMSHTFISPLHFLRILFVRIINSNLPLAPMSASKYRSQYPSSITANYQLFQKKKKKCTGEVLYIL